MLTIIIGKSASGKDTIQRELIESYNIQNIITTTTRPIREGEQDGKDYCFISTKMFEKAIEDNMFLEYRVYNTSVGNKHDLNKEMEEERQRAKAADKRMELFERGFKEQFMYER